ncbi:SIR2-like domain protein [Leptospira ellinghausenii]|uniref:SIR2-like domain protein n=1 Tax=Leptospira ellinghausenii TaxID=1917822 RepID=A0A2P2DIQ8_9LEPT|nr:SIR2 family protein [Leptospira ellinghausenii]GBF44460.1 SIR2-like domain protein [Leptospira ellinghausenii]
MSEHPGYRIFVLGAGFSQPAGLPLAGNLFEKVVQIIENQYGRKTKFQTDLDEFKRYARDTRTSLDLESFMSYLDIEHYLKLRGSKTFNEEGNESQIMIRRAIGKIIQIFTPSAEALPKVYYKFVEKLRPHDIILTLNYDLILERVLEHLGIPFRLFPMRYSEVSDDFAIGDSSKDEIIILKLHGSVDWFDEREFRHMQNKLEDFDGRVVTHPVFSDPNKYQASPIVEGPRFPDDNLKNIYRIKKIDEFYIEDTSFEAPFILAPSAIKFVYAKPLMEFWHGLGRAGAANLGLSVIGFSLPSHDEYIRILLFKIAENYKSLWNTPFLNTLKEEIKVIDFRKNQNEKNVLLERYSFFHSSEECFWFEGFNEKSVNFLFKKSRK